MNEKGTLGHFIYNCLINYSEKNFGRKFKSQRGGKNFWFWNKVEFVAVGFSSFFFHPTTTNVIKLFYVLVAAAVPTFGSSQENLTFNFFFLRCCSHFPPKLKLRKLFFEVPQQVQLHLHVFRNFFLLQNFQEKNSVGVFVPKTKFSRSHIFLGDRA